MFILSTTLTKKFCIGGNQADEPAAAAQEGAHHQRNHRHEGEQTSQRRQLPGRLPRDGGALGHHGVPTRQGWQ